MTVKEKRLAQLRASGETMVEAVTKAGYMPNAKPETKRVEGYKTLQKPDVREYLQKLMAKQDLTIENALTPIAKALKAKKVVSVEGDFYETEVDDLDLQLKASDRVLKLHGAYQNGSQNPSLHLHLHKQSQDLGI